MQLMTTIIYYFKFLILKFHAGLSQDEINHQINSNKSNIFLI